MRAPERLHGTRFVAAPLALDAVIPDLDATSIGGTALRFALDDLLVIHGGSYMVALGEAIIQEKETGFVGWWLTPDELRDHVLEHIDWPLPDQRPALAQGLVAGVPAKLWLAEDRALLLCNSAYAHELEERL